MTGKSVEDLFSQIFQLADDTFPAKNKQLGLTAQSWRRLAFSLDGANRRGVGVRQIWKEITSEVNPSLIKNKHETQSIVMNLALLFIGVCNIRPEMNEPVTIDNLNKIDGSLKKYLTT